MSAPTLLSELVNDYLDAKASAEKWTRRAEELRELVVQSVGVGNRHEVVPGAGVRVDPPQRRYSASHARLVLLPDQYDLTLDNVSTVGRATENLPPELVDLCRVPWGKPRVVTL